MKGVDNFENIGEFTLSAPNFLVDIYGVLLTPKREVVDTAEIFQNPLEINYHLLEFLKQKRHNGSKIGIISNVAQYQFEKEFWSKLTDLEREIFNQIILSGNEGVSKPDPKIFQIALERLGEIPENCVLVDDSPTNVEVARTLGINGIIYQNFNQFKQEMEKTCQNCQRQKQLFGA